MARKLSPQTVSVLAALAADPLRWRHGYELGQEVGLKAGSLYPILMRLCDQGLLESVWEAEVVQGRPPRHLYRILGEGVRALSMASAQKINPKKLAPSPVAVSGDGLLAGGLS